ncbi:GNAT family N-acetyltransferase [Methylobacter sp. G7]|uniref:GNAT family N-acetyltransferase n=1 Tax=Methylobacter sp. G7 TaxID=3230117 RepID=UPI003D8091F0
MTGRFRIEVLNAQHDREKFSCGVEALDRYLLERVTQDVRRRATACYLALETDTDRVAGYYTLAAGGVPLTDMPEDIIKRLPRYPSVPVAKLGRLAVDADFQGQRLGGALLWDAVMRTLRSEMAVFAVVVDAKNEHAEAFYRHHGFTSLGSLPKQLILSLTNLTFKG